VSIRALALAGAIVAMGMGLAAPARAITVELDFTAVDFPPASPNASISGRFTYEAASLTSPATSLTSVDLTISGHTYTLGEVGVALFGDTEVIGSTIEGVGNLQSGVNTFVLSYIPATGMPDEDGFQYGAVGNPDISESLRYSEFSLRAVGAAPAPEPATWALLLIGFLGAGALAVRRRFSRAAA
jgi:hypothetical protein